jgi:hypothetical protein
MSAEYAPVRLGLLGIDGELHGVSIVHPRERARDEPASRRLGVRGHDPSPLLGHAEAPQGGNSSGRAAQAALGHRPPASAVSDDEREVASESSGSLSMACPSCFRYGAPREEHRATWTDERGREHSHLWLGPVILDPACSWCEGRGSIPVTFTSRQYREIPAGRGRGTGSEGAPWSDSTASAPPGLSEEQPLF